MARFCILAIVANQRDGRVNYNIINFYVSACIQPRSWKYVFAANGARFGFSKTHSANLGYHTATWIVTFLIEMGFGWITTELPNFLLAIKYAGSAYIFYLAWGLFRAGFTESNSEPKPPNFVNGFILLILNPKAYLIIVLLFTQFLATSESSQLAVILFITTLFTVNNIIAFAVWAYIGERLMQLFNQGFRAQQINIFFGIILALVGVWMLLN